MLAIITAAIVSVAAMQAPPAAAPLSLWRLDCGRIVTPDARPLPWTKHDLPVPCYLVRHGDRYLLWDAGTSARALKNAHPTIKLDRTLTEQLAQIGVKPDAIDFLGISHFHGDHTGQAAQFPKARLIMGAADFNALKGPAVPEGVAPTHLAPWVSGGAPVSALIEDMDVFGDGRVMVLMAPGHTPGHLALLVKLAGRPVMLSGDLWLSHAEAVGEDAPTFTASHAELAASRARFRKLLYKYDALAIIQHEHDDIDKLPPFPRAAQ
jgi:glyoxylase-like metal-dependent hydrolase (beta-lactamase superfamily II)